MMVLRSIGRVRAGSEVCVPCMRHQRSRSKGTRQQPIRQMQPKKCQH
jgi:hypothetical protein